MCYHPNILVCRENSVIKQDGSWGMQRIKIIFSNSKEFKGYEWYLKENERIKKETKKCEQIKYKLIPCGKCLQCRTQEKNDWTNRIELESKKYEHNYFITLTYNDENIYIPEYTINKKTGEKYEDKHGIWQGSLVKKDLQQFIKSTRQWFKRDFDHDGVKFYACGEYGGQTLRPHYHVILMNCPELKKEFVTKKILTNENINRIWHKGFTSIGECNWETIAYTAGYCQKKLFGEYKDEHYAKLGQEPIFANMSRRPGIGFEYYNENKEKIYKLDEIITSKGKSVKPPRYFDRKMQEEDWIKMMQVKEKRNELAENRLKTKMRQTALTIKEQLQIEESTAEELFRKTRKEGKFINESLYRPSYT